MYKHEMYIEMEETQHDAADDDGNEKYINKIMQKMLPFCFYNKNTKCILRNNKYRYMNNKKTRHSLMYTHYAIPTNQFL